MILTQKPAQHFPLAQPILPAHRRHPSAPPAVVVQPTKTPGLLSIAKPHKALPQRQLPSNQRKDAQRTGPKPNKVARAPALLNPAEITEKRPANAVLQAPVSPTPVRGRVVPKAGKERSAPRSKHGRQPSPPIQPSTPPSQAEVQIPSSNPFNPFLETKVPAAIPVPKPQRPQQHNPKQQLARSDPTQSHMRPRKDAPRDRFPICDDMTDAGDISDVETPPPVTPPTTPLRKQAFNDNNTRTAPNTKSAGGFPFNYSSPPSAQKKGRKHRRSPSEGVFNMSLSSDEEISSGAGNVLLEYARKRPQQKAPATPSPSFSKATATSTFGQSGAFFASSMFQNSPSPDELPDPSQFN